MSYLAELVAIALGMGVVGLLAFLWSMRTGQYEDLDGAAERVLLADASEAPLLAEPPERMRSNVIEAKTETLNSSKTPHRSFL